MKYEVKELDLGGILDNGFSVFKDHFFLFLKITLILHIPFSMIQVVVTILSLGSTTGVFDILVIPFALISLLVVTPLTNGATVFAIGEKYLDKQITATEAFRAAVSFWGKLLVTNILRWIIISLGLLLLVIPGLYLALCFWFSDYVVVLEGTSGVEALTRSRSLMHQKGNFGKAIVLGLLLFTIGLAGGFAVSMVPTDILTAILKVPLQACLLILGSCVGIVFYFSARCTLEAFDLTVLSLAVGERDEPEPDELYSPVTSE